MTKNKIRSVSFWGTLKLLALASVTTSCFLPSINCLSQSSSPNFKMMKRTILQQASTVQYPVTWHPIDMTGEPIWPQVDSIHWTNVSKWIRKENRKPIKEKVEDFFKPQEGFSYYDVNSLEISIPRYHRYQHSEHPDWVEIKIELLEGKFFPDGRRNAIWETPLSSWNQIDKFGNLVSSIDLENKQTVAQWIRDENKKTTPEKIADLIKGDLQSVIDGTRELIIKWQHDHAHVSLTLKEGYRFINPANSHDMLQEWDINFVNDLKLIQQPKFTPTIGLDKTIDIKNWVANENHKSIPEKIADLFGEQSSLNEQNVDSIKLDVNADGGADIFVSLKGDYKFYDTHSQQCEGQVVFANPVTIVQNPTFNFDKIDLGNQTISQWLAQENNESFDNKVRSLFVEAAGLTSENAFIDVKESTNKSIMVTVTLKEGYVFSDGTNSKTKTVYLTNSEPVAKTSNTTSVIVGSSVSAVIFTIVTLTLIMTWIFHKQHKINKLNAQLKDNQSPKKLVLTEAPVNEKTVTSSPNHQNDQNMVGKTHLQNSKSTIQKESNSPRNINKTVSRSTSFNSPTNVNKSTIQKESNSPRNINKTISRNTSFRSPTNVNKSTTQK